MDFSRGQGMKLATRSSGFSGTKRLAYLAGLTALSLIMFMLESLIPSLPVPGAKLGLSNIFVLVAIMILSPFDAFILLTARVFFGGLFSGNLFSAAYGLPAGLASLILTSLLVGLIPKISLVSVSVLSAVVNNTVQNIVFCLISGTFAPFVYLPYLVLCGVFSGAFVGVCAYFLLHKIPLRYLECSDSFSRGEIINSSEARPTP